MLVDTAQLARAIEASDRLTAVEGGCRRAAVFVLLTQRRQTELLLIQRADRGDPWSNHVAFPGGHLDKSDADALAAAHRETLEEVGIGPEAITYLADLGHFPGRQLKVDVQAFVGLWTVPGQLKVNPAEVAAVFEVPVEVLVQQHLSRGYRGSDAGRLGDRLIYTWADRTIWGITARIVHRLLCLLAPLSSAVTDRQV